MDSLSNLVLLRDELIQTGHIVVFQFCQGVLSSKSPMFKVAYAKNILLHEFLLGLLRRATDLLQAMISFDQRCVVELIFQTSVLRLEKSESHRVSICIFPVFLIHLVVILVLISLKCVPVVEWSIVENRCTL